MALDVLDGSGSAATLDTAIVGGDHRPVHLPVANGTPVAGYQQIVSATLATAQTLTVPGGATIAIVQAEAVDIRWRDDGTAPTAGVGMLLPAGQSLTFKGNLAVLKFIRTAANAILNVSFYT